MALRLSRAHLHSTYKPEMCPESRIRPAPFTTSLKEIPIQKKACPFFPRDTLHSHWSAHYVVESFYECFRHPLQMPLNLKGDASLQHSGHNEGELLIRQDHIKRTDDWSSNVHWKRKGNIKLILWIIWHKFWSCLEVVSLCAWLHAVVRLQSCHAAEGRSRSSFPFLPSLLVVKEHVIR